MKRALRVFVVSYRGVRLRIRAVPHSKDVYTELTGAKWRKRADLPRGFFLPYTAANAKCLGLIVLAANEDLEEIIPHEVTHAVLYKMKQVHTDDDENFALTVGILSKKIHDKLWDIDYAK